MIDPLGNVARQAFDARAIERRAPLTRYWPPRSGDTTARITCCEPWTASGDANFYRYVGNDPLNRVDPFGLEASVVGSSSGHVVMGTLYAAEGETLVSRREAGGGTPWQPAPIGTVFYGGDRLRTGIAGRAGVRFSDGTLVRVNENSTLEFDDEIESEDDQFLRKLKEASGSGYFFQRDGCGMPTIKTPVVTVAVRG